MSKINSVIDYIDPNKENISINQEDLSKYVNLTVRIPSRNYSENQEVNSIKDRNFSLLSGSNFKVGEKEYNLLTDSYVDVSYTEISKNGAKRNRELFGIKSIDVSFDPQFIPQVTMEFTDVRAFTLMGPTEQTYLMNGNKMENGENETLTSKDFFNAVFHFPYPKFTLYLKGYYGNSISFDLAVNEFSSRFNSSTGDFDVTIKFLGYMYGMYTDIPMSFVLASPYFNEDYWKSRVDDGSFVFPSYDENNVVETKKNGGIIPTYTEFLTKYAKLIKPKNDGEYNISSINNISKYNTLKTKIEQCDKFFNAYNELLNKLRTIGIESKDHFVFGCFDSDFHGYNNYVGYRGQHRLNEIKSLGLITKTIKDTLFNLFNENAGSNVDMIFETKPFHIDTSNKNNEKSKHFKRPFYFVPFNDKTYKLYSEDKAGEVELKYNLKLNSSGDIVRASQYEPYDNVESCKYLINTPNKKEKINNSSIDNGSYGSTSTEDILRIYTWNKMDFLKDDVENLKNEFKKQSEQIIEEVDKEVSELSNRILEFSPTVENVYRMIYAHLDTFLNKIYKTVKNVEICDTKKIRELENSALYHVDYKRNGSSTDVPAFPLVAKINKNKREIIYPGSIIEFSKRPEIELVNTIFEKTKALRSDIDEANDKISKAITQPQDGAYGLPSCEFIPLLMTDLMMGDGENPYINVFNKINKETTNVDDKVKEVFKLLSLRIVTYAHYYREIKGYNTNAEDIGKVEAFNFWKAFPSLDNDVVKKIIEDESAYWNILDENVFNRDTKTTVYFSNEEKKLFGTKNIDNSYLPLLCNDFNIKDNVITKKDNKTSLNRDNFNLIFNKTRRYSMEDSPKNVNECYNGKLNNMIIIKPYDINTFNVLERVILSEYFRESSVYDEKQQKNLFYNYKTTENKNKPTFNETKITTDDDFLIPLKRILESTLSLEEKAWCLLSFGNKDSLLFNTTYLNKDYYGSNKKGDYYGSESFIFREYVLTLLKHGSMVWLDYQMRNNKVAEIEKKINDILNPYGYKYNILDSLTSHRDYSIIKNITPEIDDNTYEFFVSWVNGGNETSKYKFFNSKPNICFKTLYNAIIHNEEENYLKKILEDICNEEVLVCTTKIANDKEISSFIKNDATFKSFKEQLKILYANNLNKDITTSKNIESEGNIEIKKSIYYTLKTIYDKWLCSNNEKIFKLQSPYQDKRTKNIDSDFNEYKRLVFIDSYNKDISNELIIDIGSMYNILSDSLNAAESPSLFSVMNEVAQKQKCQFLTLPVYNSGNINDIFTPKNIYDKTHKLNETGATYVVLYPGETSHILNCENEEDDFIDDGFDIANYKGELTDVARNVFEGNTFNKCAFGVTYGMQNQNYFKDIKISMDDPSVTDYSIANTLKLAEGAKGGDVNTAIFLSNSLYPIFANRAYNCTVEMMGCACITPLMYFQLNNIPMFRGAYIITNVSHKITPDDFTTTFTGTRIPKFNYGVNRKVFDTNTLLDRLNVRAQVPDLEVDTTIDEKTKEEVTKIIKKTKESYNDNNPVNNDIDRKQTHIEDIKVGEYPIVTFAQYPQNNKPFNECNAELRKLLYDIAKFIKNNNEIYKDLSIKVISGYRKGVSKSQHNKGEALDLQAIKRTDANKENPEKDRELNKDLFSILCRFVENKRIDQLIWELHDQTENSRTANPNTLHISCKSDLMKNRCNIFMGRIINNKYVAINKAFYHPLFIMEIENVRNYKA